MDSQCEVFRSHDPTQADVSQRLAATGVNCTHLLSLGLFFFERSRKRRQSSRLGVVTWRCCGTKKIPSHWARASTNWCELGTTLLLYTAALAVEKKRMQDGHWANLLAKAPSRTVARGTPSSPHARSEGLPVAGAARHTSSLGSLHLAFMLVPQMNAASAFGRTSSSSIDTMYSDKMPRGSVAPNNQARSDHTRGASRQIRTQSLRCNPRAEQPMQSAPSGYEAASR